MTPPDLVQRAYAAFHEDAAVPPPLSLRSGDALDGYDDPEPYDPALDEPTDRYLEGHAFWGVGYLDARSWRHYLPRLIDYTFRHPDDPAMVAEALVRSLRPPDRYPPRLASLTPRQEHIVTEVLEQLALGDRGAAASVVQAEAQQALEEWWLPNPRCRPTPEEVEAARHAPITYRVGGGGPYRLELPDTLTGSGLRRIPEEARDVETWGGYLGGDAHTVVAVNVTPLATRALADSIRARAGLFRGPVAPRPAAVPGARDARRLDGLTHLERPVDAQRLVMVFAATRTQLVTLSVRAWPRDDVDRVVEHIVSSLAVFEANPSSAT